MRVLLCNFLVFQQINKTSSFTFSMFIRNVNLNHEYLCYSYIMLFIVLLMFVLFIHHVIHCIVNVRVIHTSCYSLYC